jgi:DNA mismatch endonuclease (patch repair protein)
LPGAPDLVFPSRKTIIFVHGCFWHAHEDCKVAHQPETRSAFWAEKFERNKARDRRNEQTLRESGWNVLTVWECETKDLPTQEHRLALVLGPPRRPMRGILDRG